MTDRIRIIPHSPEDIPDCSSFEVWFADGDAGTLSEVWSLILYETERSQHLPHASDFRDGLSRLGGPPRKNLQNVNFR